MVVLGANRNYKAVECANGHTVAYVLRHTVTLGDPDRTCKQCGLAVHIPELREWPDLTDEQRRSHVRSVVFGGLFGGAFFGVLIGVALMLAGLFASLPDAAMIALFFVGLASGFALYAWRAVANIRRSVARAAMRVRPVG